MSQSAAVQVPFMLMGQFLGFIVSKKHQPRALRLRWLEQEIVIQLAKYLRDDRELAMLLPGMQVQVWGTQKMAPEQSKLKLKARKLLRSSENPDQMPAARESLEITPQLAATNAPKPLKLKVCTKSDCMKRGGKAICKLLDQAEQEWGSALQVQETGCMGKCKSGPHLVVMPDRVSYSRIKPQEVPAIIAKHSQSLEPIS